MNLEFQIIKRAIRSLIQEIRYAEKSGDTARENNIRAALQGLRSMRYAASHNNPCPQCGSRLYGIEIQKKERP